MTPLAVSVPEASRLLGLSRSTTYAAVKRGDIPSIRIGGRVLIPLRKLEALVDADGGEARDNQESTAGVIAFNAGSEKVVDHAS